MSSAVDKLIAKAAEKTEAKRDPALHTHKAPEGYHLRGVSTLLDRDGNVAQTWVKTAREMDDPAAILDAFAVAVQARDIPAAPVVAQSTAVHDADLLTVYPMGDPHLGMLSWHHETGQDFDLQIAERNLFAAVDRLVWLSPPSERALLVNLGDFFHADNQTNRTARSGHALDVDSRWAKILRVGIGVFTRCIDRALEKHLTVRVVCEIGNHDDMSAMMLAVCLDHHYRLNPRVEVDTSPAKFHWLEFGTNLLGITHGDTVKAAALPGVMACDQAEAWGRTKHRFWYTGHVHHESVKEYPGCIVETFRTLAARDAWHAGQGYRSGRSMVCDVLHRTRGRILRHSVDVEDLP